MGRPAKFQQDNCMTPLNGVERSQVAAKLEGIFTLTPEEAAQLMEDNPPGCRALLSAFAKTTEKAQQQAEHSREWFSHIMVRLEPSQVIRQNSGKEARIVAPSYASLIHSYPVENTAWAELGRERELPNRAIFVESLKSELSSEVLEFYKTLLARCPLNGEIVAGNVMERARQAVLAFYHANVHEVARLQNIPPSVPLNTDLARFLRKRAFDKFYAAHAHYRNAITVEHVRETPVDQLIMRALIHVEANRVLLEIGRYGNLAKQAVELLEPFLALLNSVGIYELPPLHDEEDARLLFKAWFGKSGLLIRNFEGWRCLPQSAFSRMWGHASQAVEHYYNKGRGRDQVAFASDFRVGAQERFAGLLALVACDWYKAKVPQEVPGEKAPTYPVQSRRDAAVINNSLAPHALELVCVMYGQLIMTNAGWGIRCERVKDYATQAQRTRDAEAGMVYSLFKAPSLADIVKNMQAFTYVEAFQVPQATRALYAFNTA